MDKATVEQIHNLTLVSSWFPLDAFVQFLQADIAESDNGNETALIKRSEAVIEKQLKGIYKVFLKLESPQSVLERIAANHATYFRGVDIHCEPVGPGRAIVKYTGFEKQHRLIGFVIIGFYTKVLEISGASNVKATFTTPIDDGKGYADLIVTWDQG